MPRAPLRFLSILMLAASLLLVGAGAHLIWHAVASSRVSDTGRYQGVLAPLNPPALVVLPAGIPLQTILVANGEAVSRGETVALVDTGELETAIQEARFRLETDRALMRCLGTLARPEGRVDLPEAFSTPSLNAPHPFRLLSALRRCEEAAIGLDRIHESHTEKAAHLLERIALEEQRKALLVQSARNPARALADREALTRAAVLTDSNRADLAQALAQLHDEERLAIATERLAIAEAFAALGESVRVAEAQLRLMERFLDTPRLQAPASGVARNVRTQSALAAPPEDTPILRLEASDPQTYDVRFRLDEATALKVPLGSEVRILPMGAAPGRLPLTGEVTGFIPEYQTQASHTAVSGPVPPALAPVQTPLLVDARIALSEDSLARMADRYSGLAFAGEGSASQISVEMAPVPLASLISASTARLGWPRLLPDLRF
ncbi:hypothetical protein [Pseudoruegeria sp. SHC-113]|uniref:hypothetical protein n=1 Tax=Pseudoruegeria sp. SHC-113 TaxID=2855439 RepID=UPI0021BA43E0|nr:hypothetical protein [Pseudoruegeria sp. SHC-113]MCT8159557.1 hypothetical protein [Pseudoruegeria sp. SHC-113]